MIQPTVSESIFESIFHSSTLGILVVDATGTIEIANSYTEQIFGYGPHELAGYPLEILIPTQLRTKHQQLRKEFQNQPKIRPMGQGRYLLGQRKDGSQFPVEVSLSYADVEGKRSAIAYVADITKQQEARDRNTLLTRIFQESLHPIYVIDAAALHFVRFNQAALNDLGYSLSELRQLHPWDIKLDMDQSAFQRTIKPILAEEVAKVTFESVFVRKDGTTFPVEVHLQSFRYDHRHVLLQTVLNISHRKEAERALIQEKETAQQYLDIANAIFVLINQDQTVALINQKGCELLDYCEEDIIGKKWFDHFVPERVREEVRSIFHRAMQGAVSEIEYAENWVLTRDKKERLIEWHNTVIQDANGQPTATLSSGVDITDKRKAEQAVTRALIEGQEEERQRVARELHDGLSQSLTAIRLHLNALETDVAQSNERNQEAFAKLKTILQITTREVKDISYNLMPSVLRDYGLVKALSFLCQTINETQQTQINLQMYGLENEPDEQLKIGLYRIAQELINNALKHAHAQRIDMQLIEHSNSIVLTVEDDGVGFTIENDSVGFIPTPSSGSQNGFGLKNIEARLKLLSGTLEIDTRPGKGTLITVEIPKI